jgi:hypothetical protein
MLEMDMHIIGMIYIYCPLQWRPSSYEKLS